MFRIRKDCVSVRIMYMFTSVCVHVSDYRYVSDSRYVNGRGVSCEWLRVGVANESAHTRMRLFACDNTVAVQNAFKIFSYCSLFLYKNRYWFNQSLSENTNKRKSHYDSKHWESFFVHYCWWRALCLTADKVFRFLIFASIAKSLEI